MFGRVSIKQTRWCVYLTVFELGNAHGDLTTVPLSFCTHTQIMVFSTHEQETMLSASSPITFPPTSSPPASKRAAPHDSGGPRPKPRVAGPFVDDDESEEDGEAESGEPAAKKRMIEHSASNLEILNTTAASNDTQQPSGPSESSRTSEAQDGPRNDSAEPITSRDRVSTWSSQPPLF